MAVALITGCSSGFGLLTALELARRGDTVFATMRNLAKSANLERQAEKEDLQIHLVQLDVTDDASVRSAVARVLADAGRIDVAINNAGIGILGAVEDVDDDEARSCFDTNVFGVVRVVRAVLPAMRAQRSGTIINVSSIATEMVPPFLSLYTASKAALEVLTESLRDEVQPFGVRVAIVSPGFFRTDVMENARLSRRTTSESPYFGRTTLVDAFQARGVANGPDARVVAGLIADLAHADALPLRNPVGQGTDVVLDARRRMGDEEFRAMVAQVYGL